MKDTQKTKERPLSRDEINAMMQTAHGLDVSAYDEIFLAKSLAKRQAATASETMGTYLERLAEEPGEAEIFFRSLSIPYSEFFRNPLTFGMLEQVILPSLVAIKKASGKPKLRIWSAGCAAGQEAWSVAILLDELISSQGHPVSYNIFATDYSEAELTLARSGVYNAGALGNIRTRHLESYFSRRGEFYAIEDCLKERVSFTTWGFLHIPSKRFNSAVI